MRNFVSDRSLNFAGRPPRSRRRAACHVAESGAAERGRARCRTCRRLDLDGELPSARAPPASRRTPGSRCRRAASRPPSVDRRGDTNTVTRRRSPPRAKPFGSAVRITDSVAIGPPQSSANARQYSSHGSPGRRRRGRPIMSTKYGSSFEPSNFFSQLISTMNERKAPRPRSSASRGRPPCPTRTRRSARGTARCTPRSARARRLRRAAGSSR